MNKVAIYLRISTEELFKNDESSSITNQRMLIHEHLKSLPELKDYKIEEYVDDGFSGTNLNRPGVQRLLDDVKKNTVKCIIVKDLSRFMRDYITLGDYLENIFPFMNVRFIAINDGYDSAKERGNGTEIDIQFKGLLYDYYSKELSSKVKQSLKQRRMKGTYTHWNPPFGYKKNPEDKTKIVVDEVGAEVVKKIFELALEGYATRKIAKILNEEGAITPGERRKQLTNQSYNLVKGLDKKERPKWIYGAVIKILANETYTGTFLYNISKVKSVGSKKRSMIDKTEWGRIENSHEGIIDKENFKKVREIMENKCFSNSKPKENLKQPKKSSAQGYLYCKECGHTISFCMYNRTYKSGVHKIYIRCFCRFCNQEGKPKYHKAQDIEERIYNKISEVYDVRFKENNYINNDSQEEKIDYKSEIDVLETKKKSKFHDYKNEIISRDEYKEIKETIEDEIRRLKDRLNDQEKIETVKEVFENKLTVDLLDKYVDRIYLGYEGDVNIEFK